MDPRLATIRRGKNSPNQNFSTSRGTNDSTTRLLRELHAPGTNPQRRLQLRGDPTLVYQFAVPWDGLVGMITRPRAVEHGGTLLTVGNFTDTIGEPHPATIPHRLFNSYFTTIIRRDDAEFLGLRTHPTRPDALPGPPEGVGPRRNVEPEPVEGTLERLGFDMPENPTPGDHPVLAALPFAMELAPGESFPHMIPVNDPRPFRDTYRAFDIYKQGLRCVLDHNGGHSVTEGGDLFHLPGLEIPDGQDDPFEGIDIAANVTTDPNLLQPNHALYAEARQLFLAWSDTVWCEIGSRMPSDPTNTGGGVGINAGELRDAFEPLINKEKKYRLADRSRAKYQLLLAGYPADGANRPGLVTLPPLKESFRTYLEQGVGATAADDLKELFRSRLVVYNSSELAVEKGVTSEADNVTLAVSDRIRTYGWLLEKLILTSLPAARSSLGLLQMLTPQRDDLALVAEGDKGAVALVMSNSSSSTAQLDATKSSKMYSGGQCDTFQDAHTCALNCRGFFGLAVEDLNLPIVLQKMMEYANLLTAREGRLFFAANRNVPGLAIHPFQDLETIRMVFTKVGADAVLYNNVLAGNDIALSNYDSATGVADTLIRDLKHILQGNGLGKFGGRPVCMSWFQKARSSGSTGGSATDNGGTNNRNDKPEGASKRQKTIDATEEERLREFGVLVFDPAAAGSSKLPVINVFKKKNKTSRAAERLCMKFLTKGQACTKGGDCKLPHVSNLSSLPLDDRKKLVKFAQDTPGLAWAPGKSPPDLVCTTPAPVSTVSLAPPTEEDLLIQLSPRPVSDPLPDDEVGDDQIEPVLATRRANERCPSHSPVTADVGAPLTLRRIFTQDVQRDFRATLGAKDPRILAKLDQPFGKENIKQSFHSEAALRHVLLPLWKSGVLHGSASDWNVLCTAYYPARILRDMLAEYGDVPFEGLQGFVKDWKSENAINEDRVRMATAALLHYNGSVADLIRWVGGPHVGAQRDHHRTLELLKESNVDQRVIDDIRRIFLDGIPAHCNAEATEDNFLAYCLYGNHSTVDDEPEKTYKAVLKDNKKGFTMLFDKRAALFMLDGHLTPQGVVDLNTPHKNPRPTFDSSFRPHPWCFAINDWTHKDNEPPLTFAAAEMGFMIWLYNLRITCPDLEIYIADDDVSGAFRLVKYHPNLMAMHTSTQAGYAVVNTGGTFGDNTSPSNFDPIGLARRQRAAAIWSSDEDIESKVLPHLPPLVQAPPPTPQEIALFRPADADGINRGVLNEDGTRIPPPYWMHVDDTLYADVGKHLTRTVCASACALFDVLGHPMEEELVPGVLSDDKFEALYNHLRKLVGRRFNSRHLSVSMLPHKKDILVEILKDWLKRHVFGIVDIAHLLGTLENHTRYARWARCWYSTLQNTIRRVLHVRHQILLRRYKRQERELHFRRQLPPGLAGRIETLIARDRALLLWKTRQQFSVTPEIRATIQNLLHYLEQNINPWEVPIGLIIPREPHFRSRGDASLLGGGFYSTELRFWSDMGWGRKVLAGIHHHKPSSPEFVHINSLEFIQIILQLAAGYTRLQTLTPDQRALYFPNGVPDIPVWLGETDNTVSKSWENRASAKTYHGQGLVAVYAELLRVCNINTQCRHLAGVKNIVADDISRNDFSLPSDQRCLKLFRKHPFLKSYDYFLPSQGLLHLLFWKLFSGPSVEPCVLPTVLGQFAPAGCTTFGSVSL